MGRVPKKTECQSKKRSGCVPKWAIERPPTRIMPERTAKEKAQLQHASIETRAIINVVPEKSTGRVSMITSEHIMKAAPERAPIKTKTATTNLPKKNGLGQDPEKATKSFSTGHATKLETQKVVIAKNDAILNLNMATTHPMPVPSSSTIAVIQTDKFMLTKVEDWKYKGFPQAIDIANAEVQSEIKNKIWSELRLLLRGMFGVTVNNKEQGNGLVVTVVEFLTKKKHSISFSDKPIAVIDVTLAPENSFFVFKILDPALAETRNINVAVLQAAVEVAFGTILLRCAEPDGDGDRNDSDICARQGM